MDKLTCTKIGGETIQFTLNNKGELVLNLHQKTGRYHVPETVNMLFNEFPIEWINVFAEKNLMLV